MSQESPLAKLSDTPHQVTVWQDPSGKPYLVQKTHQGGATFTPLETALANLQQPPQSPIQPQLHYQQPPARSSDPDPIRTLLLGIAVVLAFVAGGYFVGFLAGLAGRSVVMVPTTPVCQTRSSSFLFWSHEQRECN